MLQEVEIRKKLSLSKKYVKTPIKKVDRKVPMNASPTTGPMFSFMLEKFKWYAASNTSGGRRIVKNVSGGTFNNGTESNEEKNPANTKATVYGKWNFLVTNETSTITTKITSKDSTENVSSMILLPYKKYLSIFPFQLKSYISLLKVTKYPLNFIL